MNLAPSNHHTAIPQIRCAACAFWSQGARCQRATSPAYSRKTSAEAHCQKWEPKP